MQSNMDTEKTRFNSDWFFVTDLKKDKLNLAKELLILLPKSGRLTS